MLGLFSGIANFFLGKTNILAYFIVFIIGFFMLFSDSILTKFGFETKSSLKKDVATLKEQKNTIIEINKSLYDLNERQENISKFKITNLDFLYKEKNKLIEERQVIKQEYIKEHKELSNKNIDNTKTNDKLQAELEYEYIIKALNGVTK